MSGGRLARGAVCEGKRAIGVENISPFFHLSALFQKKKKLNFLPQKAQAARPE